MIDTRAMYGFMMAGMLCLSVSFALQWLAAPGDLAGLGAGLFLGLSVILNGSAILIWGRLLNRV